MGPRIVMLRRATCTRQLMNPDRVANDESSFLRGFHELDWCSVRSSSLEVRLLHPDSLAPFYLQMIMVVPNNAQSKSLL